jgi:CheY-like chemotaxis protein
MRRAEQFPAPAEQAPSINSLPIALLVDRDDDTRAMYAEFLRRLSFDVDEADDGWTGLALAFARHPNVIVTETRLSGIDGYDLCKFLRSDSATRDIPIVFVTEDALPADIARAEAAGADTVLAKPCLREHLARTIDTLFLGSRTVRLQSSVLRHKAAAQLDRASELIQRSEGFPHREALNHTFDRHATTTPPVAPPVAACPLCDRPLRYVTSQIGGVSVRNPEQWDYFECPTGCGTFQYRHRTRKLRRAS